MQGLGCGAIALAGSDGIRERYLPKVADGSAIAAFALSEPDAGSDVAAMSCSAAADGDDYILDGEKTWISNGGIADRSEEHTSELQSLMRISYAVFCLKKKIY